MNRAIPSLRIFEQDVKPSDGEMATVHWNISTLEGILSVVQKEEDRQLLAVNSHLSVAFQLIYIPRSSTLQMITDRRHNWEWGANKIYLDQAGL